MGCREQCGDNAVRWTDGEIRATLMQRVEKGQQKQGVRVFAHAG